MREARDADRRAGGRCGALADGETAFAADGVLELGATSRCTRTRRFGSRRSRSRSRRRSRAACLRARRASCGALLSHTAGLRCESAEPLPARLPGAVVVLERRATGRPARRARRRAARRSTEAMRERVLEPLGLARDRLRGAAGAGARARAGGRDRAPRRAASTLSRPRAGRRAGSGRRSSDLLRFARAPPRRRARALHEPQVAGARRAATRSAGGCASSRTADGARPRRLGRGLPVAAPARAGGAARARRAHEQLARQRPHPPRRRARSGSRPAARAGRPGRVPATASPGDVRARRRRGDRRGRATALVVRSARPIRSPGTVASTPLPGAADRRRRFGYARRRADEPPARLPARRASRASAGSRCRGSSVIAGVAAGHPATAAAGVEILADGGSAADAAVAAALASCVAETVMTGLLGGGHAIHLRRRDRHRAQPRLLLRVPGLGAEPREPELVHLEVPFGAELVHYAVGPASCAVPGRARRARRAVAARTAGCRGRGSSSRRCGSRATASRCRPRTSPASRCSSR